MPISIRQWREKIGIFNSYKFKTSFKSDNSSFLGNLFPNKLILFIFLCYIYDLFNYCFCFPTEILHCLLIIFITDNRTISIFNLLNPVFGFYQNFKIQLIKTSYFLQYVLILNYLIELFLNLLLTHGDIEANPGPRGKHSQYFSFCHWNLNSLPAHDYEKFPLLEAFNTLHKFYLICLQFQLRRSLLLLMATSYFVQTILVIPKGVGYFVTLYRSPSQSHDCFQNFLKEFEKLLSSVTKNKSDFTLIVGDFNARSTTWWSGDITTTEGTNIEALSSYHGLEQVINEPTYILQNSSSCIDLIFADKPNLIVESGVFPSLHLKCHHQIIYSKLKKANVDGISKSLNSVEWEFNLSGKNVHQQAQYLNEILINVFV